MNILAIATLFIMTPILVLEPTHSNIVGYTLILIYLLLKFAIKIYKEVTTRDYYRLDSINKSERTYIDEFLKK